MVRIEDIDRLLELDVRLRGLDGRFVEEPSADGEAQGDPYPMYPVPVTEFFYAASAECWSAEYIESGAGAAARDRGRIARASLDEIRAMLTWCVRGERFCDGHWASILEEGIVFAILDRLRAIRGGMGAGDAAVSSIRPALPR